MSTSDIWLAFLDLITLIRCNYMFVYPKILEELNNFLPFYSFDNHTIFFFKEQKEKINISRIF